MRGLLHELRNPLSSILTAASLLQDPKAPFADEPSSESQMLLEVIGKEATRLNRILTEFDHYIRVPSPQPAAFDLVELVESVCAHLQETDVIPSSIEITKQLPESCMVWADESQIRMVLDKLFQNAIEALPGGKESDEEEDFRINVRLEQLSDTAKFCLGDSGKGFQEESRTRAFQPFYTTKAQRLGLGLSVAKANIEAATGELRIENSAPDQQNPFTEVCFSLPLTIME